MYSHLLGGSNTYPPGRQKNIPWEHKVVKPKRGEKLPLYCSPSETSSWELLASFQIKNKT